MNRITPARRKINITGVGKPIAKRGPGLGTGPVGRGKTLPTPRPVTKRK